MKKALCAADTAAFLASSILSALLGAALLCGAAMADPAGPENPATPTPAAKGGTELQEIVVTAEKRESTVQATAISITALTSEDFKQENITTGEYIVGKVPAIPIRPGGPGQPEYEMRGQSPIPSTVVM